jgi:hypothetical protein
MAYLRNLGRAACTGRCTADAGTQVSGRIVAKEMSVNARDRAFEDGAPSRQ